MPNPNTRTPANDVDVMQRFDLSQLCDGRRTDFPLQMQAEAVNVMLNGAHLEQDLDYILGRKEGQSILELRRPPTAGASLVVLRAPARDDQTSQARSASATQDVPAYEQLPQLVKDNISAEQWPAASRLIVSEDSSVPETADYINLKNGQIHTRQMGERAESPLLAAHNLSGGGGQDDAQFHNAPPGAPRNT